MILSVFEKKIDIPSDHIKTSWTRLQQRETFVKAQIPPYKVEFHHDTQCGPFKPKELNIHHGPWLHLPAIIGEVTDHYRDLHYLYGAYVISFRLIRPIQLEFFKENNHIRLKLQAYVHPWLKTLWPRMNQIFWMGFKI